MSILAQFSSKNLLGNLINFSDFSNQVLLVVNTASNCIYTNQYLELEIIYRRFISSGFSVLAFPCNQFAFQEQGSHQKIAEFCYITCQVTFPVFEKVEVNGKNTHPFFDFLKKNAPGIFGTKFIKWNFTKFLLDRNANVVGRWGPKTRPEELSGEIRKLL